MFENKWNKKAILPPNFFYIEWFFFNSQIHTSSERIARMVMYRTISRPNGRKVASQRYDDATSDIALGLHKAGTKPTFYVQILLRFFFFFSNVRPIT